MNEHTCTLSYSLYYYLTLSLSLSLHLSLLLFLSLPHSHPFSLSLSQVQQRFDRKSSVDSYKLLSDSQKEFFDRVRFGFKNPFIFRLEERTSNKSLKQAIVLVRNIVYISLLINILSFASYNFQQTHNITKAMENIHSFTVVILLLEVVFKVIVICDIHTYLKFHFFDFLTVLLSLSQMIIIIFNRSSSSIPKAIIQLVNSITLTMQFLRWLRYIKFKFKNLGTLLDVLSIRYSLSVSLSLYFTHAHIHTHTHYLSFLLLYIYNIHLNLTLYLSPSPYLSLQLFHSLHKCITINK